MTDTGNLFGQILRIREKSGTTRAWNSILKCLLRGRAFRDLLLDNLAFDKKGNLWIVTDISDKNLNRSVYKKFGNNGLFVIRTQGPDAGRALQFASSPIGAELTGLWFAPDQKGVISFRSTSGRNHEGLSKSHEPLASRRKLHAKIRSSCNLFKVIDYLAAAIASVSVIK
ncbi:hypothetical protein DQM68_17860 [Leptospira mayottensis]|uniref:alkaline phosphatase PhoX n=1 Tax=Leptospira mayottensis TaxID=1137606 RepID=UPI000E35A576|nr:alkaline phosphatase PhoX [Leptospira mayottensis]AXR62574.1 hypothetical protein DQM68_17860 [Leptospira mayottensis]